MADYQPTPYPLPPRATVTPGGGGRVKTLTFDPKEYATAGVWRGDFPTGHQIGSPFFDPQWGATTGDSPQILGPAVGVRNTLAFNLLQQLGLDPEHPVGTDFAGYHSPYTSRLMDTLGAFGGMQRRELSQRPTYNDRGALLSQLLADSTGAEIGGQRGLTIAEPQRLSDLLTTLFGTYGLGSDLWSAYQNELSQLANTQSQLHQQKQQQLGQIPIVGPLVAGLS